jgi:hypothetical protein
MLPPQAAAVLGAMPRPNPRPANPVRSTQGAGSSAETREETNTAECFVARAFYKELRENGYRSTELLAFSIELIALVTQDLPERR